MAAPGVRLGEAEVGFRMHLGVMKVSGADISNDEMAELSVTTNGATITGVWKGHPLFGEGFTATATFTEKDGGWEYGFEWKNLEGWKFFVESVSFPDVVVPRTDNSGVLYSRNHGILELGILENKRVVIIGLGSFGSQIAIELAKAGVGNFALMDFDRIELHNLARHTATTRDLGRLKTDVLREAIEGKNPYAHVDLFPIDINQHLETLLDECRKADLVICATDNNLSRINISQALINTQTPGIFGSALTRAEGGCVFHYQPGGPCYNCFLGNGLIAGAREEVSSVEAGRRSGQIAAYTSPEDADAVVQVGLSADIEPICNMVVKLALVELSRGTESGISSLEKELVFPAYLWVNRRERHFLWFASFADPGNRPTIMRWYGIRMQKDENCVLCGKAHDFVVEQKLLDDMGVTLDDLQAQTADLDQTLAEL